MARSFLRYFDALARFPAKIVETDWRGRPAGDALVPKFTEAFKLVAADRAFELPVADSLTYYFARSSVLTSLNGSLKCGHLFSRQSNTHLQDFWHRSVFRLGSIIYYPTRNASMCGFEMVSRRIQTN